MANSLIEMARGKCVFLVLLSSWCFMVETTASGYGLSAHDITETSAVLQWNIPSKSSDMDFKVLCAGRCHYVTSDGSPVTNRDFLARYTSGMVDHILVGGLKMNFNYSCVVIDAGTADVVTKAVLFKTNHGAPEAPRPPEVREVADNIHGKKIVSIKLFPTSTKYGPISGYEIHFNLVNESNPGTQWNMPTSPLANLEDAKTSSLPVDFKMTYSGSSLPSILDIEDHVLQNALKGGSTYHVVTVAFTEEQTHTSIPALYSVSGWSKSFTIPETPPSPPSSHMPFSAQKGQKSVYLILGGLLPFLLILGCFGACVGYRKLQSYKRKRESYKKLQKHSQLPLGIYAPKHERIPTSHREILDRVTRDMEAGQLGTFAKPQPFATPDGNHHGCLGSSGEGNTFYVSPPSPKRVGTYQEDKEYSTGMFTKHGGSAAANEPPHPVLQTEPPLPSIKPMMQSKHNLPDLEQSKTPNVKRFSVKNTDTLFAPAYNVMFPPTFGTGTPNIPPEISDSTPLFVQNTDSEARMSSQLLKSYYESCGMYSDSSSDLTSEDEEDLVYACVDFKTKSFVGVTKENDSNGKHEPTIRIMRGFYGLPQEDEVNIVELPKRDTLPSAAGNPSCTLLSVEDLPRDGADRETCTADANTSEAIHIGNTKVPVNITERNDAVTAAKKFRLMAMHYSKCKWPSYSSSDSDIPDDESESSSM